MERENLISFVLSFRNEEEVIPVLIERLTRVLKTMDGDYEIIFVNDASTDRSLGLLKQAAEADERIKIITMSRRFGVGQCLMAGIRHASGDAVISMDADLQDPPELLPEMIQKWKEGADIIFTVRTKREGESAFKVWLTKTAYRVLRFASETDLPVEAGDFKLMSRRVVNALLKFREKDPYLRGLVSSLGFKQVPVYYERQKRYAGRSHFRLFDRGPVSTFLSGLLSFSELPLYAAFGFGFLFLILSVLCGGFILVQNLLGISPAPYSLFAAALCLVVSIQLLVSGILGLYLGRIYNEVKRRPLYLIESKIGFGEQVTSLDCHSRESGNPMDRPVTVV